MAHLAHADPASQCQAQSGTYLAGRIEAGPVFVLAHHQRHGVALSHTRIILQGDDGQIYDIRADNVFAAGYDEAPDTVPSPLSALKPGDRLSLCGRLFQAQAGHLGMDWVHTNCGKPPRHNAPNGWLVLIEPGISSDQNLEGSSEYCHLW